MSEELKPCPLCGSTDIACFAEECGDDYDNVPTFRAVVACLGCHEEGCDSTYDDEPCFGIEAYFRADHPLVSDCEDPWDIECVLERHMAERWNRRAERTCSPVVADDGAGAWGVYCSECGYRFAGPYGKREVPEHMATRRDIMPRFCSNCGAKVVGKQ